MADELRLPPVEEMVIKLRALAGREQAIALCLSALETGTFRAPNGTSEGLGRERISIEQCALLAHLARNCPKQLSVEVGFGMGSSAAIILGARRLLGKPFSHLIYDPYGLPGNRGQVVQAYLKARFPKGFRRLMKQSEIGLAALLDRLGPGSAGLIFIDGGHRFENVMTDFVLADQLCCVGGYIVLDDAWFPAIESVINYVTANRPDYAVAHLAVPNCTVLMKLSEDNRSWDAFKPFEVPNRENWTPAVRRPSQVRG